LLLQEPTETSSSFPITAEHITNTFQYKGYYQGENTYNGRATIFTFNQIQLKRYSNWNKMALVTQEHEGVEL
jgi:hypothetical protein